MKVLVTGVTGFIGQHVRPLLLESSAELSFLVRSKSTIQAGQVIEGSLDRLSEIKSEIAGFNPDVCLHLAWEGIPDYSFAVSKKNLDQSVGLVDLLLDETSCRKIVVSGSCFEYGPAEGCVTESTPEVDSSAIGWAKNSLKNYLALRSKEKASAWVWTRVFYAFGPGQRSQSLIPALFQAAKEGRPSPIRNPQNANDFVYIEDVARALTLATLNPVESGVYNLGSGALFKVSDIWNLVQQRLGQKPFLAKESGGPSGEQAIGCFADIRKAKEKLGWAPKWSIPNGVDKFVEHLMEQV